MAKSMRENSKDGSERDNRENRHTRMRRQHKESLRNPANLLEVVADEDVLDGHLEVAVVHIGNLPKS
jgi:hypothetical protein